METPKHVLLYFHRCMAVLPGGFLFGLWFYIPVNSYGHVEMVSLPWASLTK